MASELTEKQAFADWKEFVDNIRKLTAVRSNETETQQRERIARLEADPEEWFKYYFPNYCYAPPAQFHKESTKRVLNNPEWYEVRIWSRELAKSARTMMEILYLALTGKKKFVLMVSSSYDNAERLLAPYMANLEANQLIIHDYGVQEMPGSWTAGEFTTRKGVAFRAVGAKQPPRGARNDHWRPDVALFDDMDTDEIVRNEERMNEQWNWIEQATISTRSISGHMLVIFCGNRIGKNCTVDRAAKVAKHVSEVNITDAQGNSSWPEKNSKDDIKKVLDVISYATQQKEYYNNPIQEGSVFKAMAYKPIRPIYDYQLLVCYTDPSYKASETSDFKATVLVGRWRDEFHVIKAFVEQTTTANMIEWHYHIMDIVGDRPCYYAMEDVFLQDMFYKEFHAMGVRRGRQIPIAPDKRSKADKFVRIETLLEPLNRMGKLYLNEEEKSNLGMQTLEAQFIALAPKSRAHDDGPDAVEGAVWLLNTKISDFGSGSIKGSNPVNKKRF